MQLNPNARLKPELSEKINTDPFDMPVPGQSLTGEPKKWPWENPPEFVNVDDALLHVVQKVQGDSASQKAFDQVIRLGMPLESIVNTITFGGFIEGLWTVDIAELLKPPLMAFLMLYSEEKQLPFVAFNNNIKPDKTQIDDMSMSDLLATTKEMNPTHFQDIKQYVNKSAEEAVEKQKRDEEIMGGFMVITPEMTEDEIIEERIDV
tara:strand:+ start:92 stop:709 length:618 start_codon:yes stop_codon:yes gene_type:complete